jgi:REP element-mobilizing transposase RayT
VDKKVWHITTATHDSRTSQRMIDYNVRQRRNNGLNPKAQPIWIDPPNELMITKIVARIVKEDNLYIMAYNICAEHMHLLLVCKKEEISKIVGKIKAITAREYNISIGHVSSPLLEKKEKKKYQSLWTQKFGYQEIINEQHLYNTVQYIKNNRIKHELPDQTPEFYALIEDICCNGNGNSNSNGTCPIVFSENK